MVDLAVLKSVLLGIGTGLLVVGAFCDLVGALGLLRFPNFFVRLHAATVATIGGAVYPLFGVTLIILALDELGPARFFMAGISFLTAVLIALTAPAGAHALARAAHRSGVPVQPKVIDRLEEDRGRGTR